jgi:hypothetical protein
MALLALCHSLIEDTLLIMVLGEISFFSAINHHDVKTLKLGERKRSTSVWNEPSNQYLKAKVGR